MSYFDSELSEKAKNWNIPMDSPRTISGKFTIFKAVPGPAWVGTVFIPIALIIGILFFALGMMDDLLTDDWISTEAHGIGWINSTGQRINNTYIPGIRVRFKTEDNSTVETVVKITNINKIIRYQMKYDQKESIKIEYSASNPQVAKIAGMSASAMPVIFAYFPVVFLIVGFLLILISIAKRNKIRNVLENGQLTFGKIIEKRKLNKSRTKNSSTADRNVKITFEFDIDNEIRTKNTYVSNQTGAKFEINQEIPVIYLQNNLKYLIYSPAFLQVEFEKLY